MYGRIGSNGEGNSDPRKISLVHCSGNVPSKYWAKVENPEWEPEFILVDELSEVNPLYNPNVEEFLYVNDFVQVVSEMPQEANHVFEVQADGTWLDISDQAVLDALEQEKALNIAIKAIEQTYIDTCNAPVTINGVTYKGGESSASGISSAATIAQGLGEETVWIGDTSHIMREMSFEDAQLVALQLAKIPRDAYRVRANSFVSLAAGDDTV